MHACKCCSDPGGRCCCGLRDNLIFSHIPSLASTVHCALGALLTHHAIDPGCPGCSSHRLHATAATSQLTTARRSCRTAVRVARTRTAHPLGQQDLRREDCGHHGLLRAATFCGSQAPLGHRRGGGAELRRLAPRQPRRLRPEGGAGSEGRRPAARRVAAGRDFERRGVEARRRLREARADAGDAAGHHRRGGGGVARVAPGLEPALCGCHRQKSRGRGPGTRVPCPSETESRRWRGAW